MRKDTKSSGRPAGAPTKSPRAFYSAGEAAAIRTRSYGGRGEPRKGAGDTTRYRYTTSGSYGRPPSSVNGMQAIDHHTPRTHWSCHHGTNCIRFWSPFRFRIHPISSRNWSRPHPRPRISDNTIRTAIGFTGSQHQTLFLFL